MSRDEKVIEGKEKEAVIDLIHDEDRGRPTSIVEVLGTKYRVLEYALEEAAPVAFLNGVTAAALRDTGGCCCHRCGHRLPMPSPLWTLMEDAVCPDCEGRENFTYHCHFCGQPLVAFLPFEVRGQARIVACCPLHHTYTVLPSIKGVLDDQAPF